MSETDEGQGKAKGLVRVVDVTHKEFSELRRYRRVALVVLAAQLTHHFKLHDMSGVFYGLPGDYVIVGEYGDKYVVKKNIFEKTYRSLETRNAKRKPRTK